MPLALRALSEEVPSLNELVTLPNTKTKYAKGRIMSNAQTLDNFSLPRPEMLSRPLAGVPWVIGVFIGAAVSFRVLNTVLDALNVGPTQLMSIGTMLAGAAIAMA
jgi:hypothetical protein